LRKLNKSFIHFSLSLSLSLSPRIRSNRSRIRKYGRSEGSVPGIHPAYTCIYMRTCIWILLRGVDCSVILLASIPPRSSPSLLDGASEKSATSLDGIARHPRAVSATRVRCPDEDRRAYPPCRPCRTCNGVRHTTVRATREIYRCTSESQSQRPLTAEPRRDRESILLDSSSIFLNDPKRPTRFATSRTLSRSSTRRRAKSPRSSFRRKNDEIRDADSKLRAATTGNIHLQSRLGIHSLLFEPLRERLAISRDHSISRSTLLVPPLLVSLSREHGASLLDTHTHTCGKGIKSRDKLPNTMTTRNERHYMHPGVTNHPGTLRFSSACSFRSAIERGTCVLAQGTRAIRTEIRKRDLEQRNEISPAFRRISAVRPEAFHRLASSRFAVSSTASRRF